MTFQIYRALSKKTHPITQIAPCILGLLIVACHGNTQGGPMRIGLYPGTFDPITLGHVDIIQRAMALVDRLVIGVAINRDKGPLFNLEERVQMVQAECAAITDKTGGEIVVHPFENLLIDCARDVGAGIIIRGLRAVADFEYEFQMVGMNRALDASIETVFLMADARRQAIASKLVKEIARLGGDVSKFVTPPVQAALIQRFG
jgi:pantetheine-phosphate adenylyltransferase